MLGPGDSRRLISSRPVSSGVGRTSCSGQRLIALADEIVDVEIPVRGHAVHAMEGEVLREVVEAEESLQG